MSLGFRIGRALKPATRNLAARVLFAHVVAEVLGRCGSPVEANRELFKLGVGAGDLVAVSTAASTQLRRLWPPGGEPAGVARFAELVFPTAWLVFTGLEPEVSTGVSEEGLVWVDLGMGEGGAFYSIAVPEGVNPLYFVAGALEGCAQVVLRIVGAGWFSLWRPLERRGVRGFLASSSRPVGEVARAVEAKDPAFFRDVSWGDSARILEEVLGARIPRPT